MVHALPDDGNRYEIIDGELLVSPSPTWLHQSAVLDLAMLLRDYARRAGLKVLVAPAAVTWSPQTEVQPDVLAAPLIEGRSPSRFEDVGVLALAVEVLSPSTETIDRTKKLEIYARERVEHVWLIDPRLQTLEVLRPARHGWTLSLRVKGGERVRAEPFQAIELVLSDVWST
jgi:Uma2 family endonuclease